MNDDRSVQADRGIEVVSGVKKSGTVVKKLFLVIFLFIIAVVAGGGFYVYQGLQPVKNDGEKILLTIPSGVGSSKIADLLFEEGLIKNSEIFKLYLKIKGEGSQFQAGSYELERGIELDEIIAKLNKGETVKEETIRFTIPEGLTMNQIADKLSDQGFVDREKFVAAITDYKQFKGEAIQHIPNSDLMQFALEGYLFPETYEMKVGSTELDIIQRLISELDARLQKLPEGWEKQLDTLGISFHEMMTIASLIEREVMAAHERPKVSGVIHNRLEISMPLQIDATVQFAFGEQKERLYYVDLEIDSPYNTYKIKGLPPGPIASPSLSAIEAALYPEEHLYFYYVTKKDGTNEHLFGRTLKEHQANIELSKRTAAQ